MEFSQYNESGPFVDTHDTDAAISSESTAYCDGPSTPTYNARALLAVEAEDRLSSLLSEHDLKLIRVPPDGDCLLSAIVAHVTSDTTQTLRHDVCAHIRDNYELYRPFCTCSDLEFENELVALEKEVTGIVQGMIWYL